MPPMLNACGSAAAGTVLYLRAARSRMPSPIGSDGVIPAPVLAVLQYLPAADADLGSAANGPTTLERRLWRPH